MIDKKKQSFGELIKLEAQTMDYVTWLKKMDLYDDVMAQVKAGTRAGIIHRVLRKEYGYHYSFETIKDLVREFGPAEADVFKTLVADDVEQV